MLQPVNKAKHATKTIKILSRFITANTEVIKNNTRMKNKNNSPWEIFQNNKQEIL